MPSSKLLVKTHQLPAFLIACLFVSAVAAFAIPGSARAQSDASKEPGKETPVWLSDLPERDAVVGFGKFGKNGWAGFEPVIIATQARTAHHGLGMHPNAHVEYVLGKKYRTFRATAAMNYSTAPGCETPVIFRVLADGKLLWESHGMHHERSRQACLLDITNTNVLRLETLYRPGVKGDQSRAHAVWIDPFVTTEPPPKAIMYLFDPAKSAQVERAQEFIYHVRDLVKKEDFDELEKAAQHCRDKEEFSEGTPLLSWFYQVAETPVSKKADPWAEHIALIERWKKAKPDSVTPLIVAAKAYSSYAWRARGHGFAGEVTEDGWKKFHERMAEGHKYLDEAMTKKISDGGLYATFINYELNEESPREKVMEVFRHGKNFPRRYYPIYTDLANYLLPRWHGAPGELQETAASLRKLLGGDLGDEVYFRMACVELRTLGEKFFDETDYKYEDLKPGFLVAIRDFSECDRFINDACLLACLAGDKETASMLFRRLDQATIDNVTWGNLGRMDYWRRKYDPLMEPAEDVQTLRDPSDEFVLAVAFAGNKHLLTSSEAPGIHNWDLSTGKIVGSFNSGDLTVREMATDRDGHAAVVCCGPRGQLLGAAALQPLDGGNTQQLMGHTGGIVMATISSDGAFCGTTSVDKTARIHKVDDLEHVVVLKHPESVFGLAISPDGKQAATTCLHGGLWLWNAETGAADGKPLIDKKHGHRLAFVSFLATGKQLVLASADGTIQLWDLATRKKQELRTSAENVESFAVSGDAHWIALGRVGGRADIYSTAPLALAHSYYGHHSRCQSIAFSPDSSLLATGSLDCNIKIWPISKLKPPLATK